MSQAISFALEALHAHLDKLTVSIDAAHFSDKRVQLRTLAKQEGIIRSCIALLEQLPIAQDRVPARNGARVYRRPQQKAS
jgi:hypothetical protein